MEIIFQTENLAEISPREKTRMAQEKAAILQKIEEEKFREAQRKKMEEEREERREKRIKVIDELIQTEKDFITSLNLTMVTFLGPDVEKVCYLTLYSIDTHFDASATDRF